MTPARLSDPTRRRLAVTAVVALVAAVAIIVSLAFTSGRGGRSGSTVALTPSATVGYFLSKYVRPDGRVDRTDQGGDTVSEGQAYALLMTAAIGDRTQFASVWGWTRQHLLLPDGLFAWRWQHGAIVGSQPASDADLGTAAALVMASERFHDQAYLAAARNLAAAIVAHEVGTSSEGPTLVAGPWALSPTEYVDPSYLAPAEMDVLASAFGGQWPAIASTAGRQLESLTTGGDLPSDWAVIGSDHRIHPSAPPNSAGSPATFGFDAVRAPVWMATSCSAGLRAAAAGLLPALERGHGEVDLNLGGHPAPGVSDPVGQIPVAAAEWAAGQQQRAWAQLEDAARANRSHPTYYTTAWVALTTLAFDHRLGSCPAA